ncbi:S8 family serine peptidase [Phnomibacter sp. MR]|uniref:S8 family serine peptidase n=1 Tax=Phnomibacter sp. MR TaxID=3042318 RepID=UPI003A7FEDB0
MKKITFCRVLCLMIALAGAGLSAVAQKQVAATLSTGQKITLSQAGESKALQAITRQQAAGKYYFLVHSQQKDLLNAATAQSSLRILAKVDNNTFVVASNQAPQSSDLQRWGVDATAVLEPIHKMQPSLAAGKVPAHALQGNDQVQLMLATYKGIGITEVRMLLSQAGFQAATSPANQWGVYSLTCAKADIQRLAALPFVAYVQTIPPPEKTLNQSSRNMAGANLLSSPIAGGGRGLTGKGVTVGVGDDADPSLHPDLSDRIINHTPGIVNDHGAHTTGTVAGAGILLPQRAGYAPKATIVSQWFGGIWTNAATYVRDYNMVLTNNSYGNIVGDCDMNGTYDLNSYLLDEQAFTFPQLLHIFASGNDGENTCSPYPFHYATVLSGMQTAKNTITSGRTDYVQLASSSSSSGPVKDGRIKPEIVTLGEAIMSTTGFFSMSNAYWGSWGTSMAAPAITGGLALLYERYRQLNGNSNPQGALMKALLLNGARDLGTPGPDYRHGFGMMQLSNSLRMLEAANYQQNNITQGAVKDTVISVPAGTHQLKVMLYWHDPAANPIAAKALINDLDLQVITPGGTTVYPLVLNPSPSGVANAATPGTDHVNNVEQIVIPTPTAGNYTIRVRGYDVMVNAPQLYAVAFDYVPSGIEILSPAAGETWTPNGPSVPITWDYNGNAAGSLTLEYSYDGGNTWNLISNNVVAATRFYNWSAPLTINTTSKIRITHNTSGVSDTTRNFSLICNPSIGLAPIAEQCEGYIKLNWTNVTGADSFQVIMKRGAEMQPIAQVSNSTLTYTIGGLSKDSVYYVSVRTVKNGQTSRWNTPIERQPNTGACSGAISNNDLKLDAIVSPVTGRQYTATALTTSTAVSIRIKNLDDAVANAYAVKYSINGGSFVQQDITTPLAANSTAVHTFSSIDFSAPGTYNITAVVTNAVADNNSSNDTLRVRIQQLANAPISLIPAFTETFETAESVQLTSATTGVPGSTRWDFSSSDIFGRLRTSAFGDVARNGSKAATMDVRRSTPYATTASNELTGTFNLSGYNTGQEVRLQFFYQQHGIAQVSHPQNKVWARGNESNSWIEVYDLAANQPAVPGEYKQTHSIELSDALANAGQQFGPATQIKFGQFGLYAAADNRRFAGYSFDDISLQLASNDLQMVAIDTPYIFSCGLTAAVPIRVQVYNSMNTTMLNIPVTYRINNGSTVQEIIPSIPAHTTITYTFASPANFANHGAYTIVATVSMPGDNISDNNSTTASIRNQPVISSFPYKEDFENGTGNWFTQGINNSWQFGTPAHTGISAAASGNNAWKTSLTAHYNDNERSYLYSPCFNINSMTAPTLSFSMAYDMEDCSMYNIVCDAVWVEYSYDGINWTKLGAAGSGTNWYDFPAAQAWVSKNQTHWHVATTALPKQAGNISLRIVVASDDAVNREGVAIDDIHVFDNAVPIYAKAASSNTVTQVVSGNNRFDFIDGGQLIATLFPNGNNLGSTAVKAWINTGNVRNDGHQYFANRSFTIKPTNQVLGNAVTVRLYFTDTDVEEMRLATNCADCTPPAAYNKLNIARYSEGANEDGTLENNIIGLWRSIVSDNIVFTPYGSGYYAEFEVDAFSEFWITDGSYSIALPVTWVAFDAKKDAQQNVQLQWQTANESNALQYEVQVSTNGIEFETIGIVAAKNAAAATYFFTDKTEGKTGNRMYRIKQTDRDGQFSFSAVRSIQFGSIRTSIHTYPNPVQNQLLLAMVHNAPIQVQWQISDAAGRIVMNGKWQSNATADKTSINTQQLQPGVYTITVTDGTQRWYHKMVKAN